MNSLYRAALLACLLAGVAHADLPEPEDHWYVVRLDGTTCGYGRERTSTTADGATETRTESHLVLNRLDAPLEFGEDDVAREDATGELLTLDARLHSSSEDTTLRVEVDPDRLVVTTTAGGRQYRREAARPTVVLGPRGIRERTRAWLAAPSAPLAYATFLPEAGRVVEVTRRFLGRDGAGHALVEEQIADVPSRSRFVLDAAANVLEEHEESALGAMSIVESDAATARAAAGSSARADSFAQTLLHANVRLPDPRRLERLRVRLELVDSDAGWPDLAGPGQRIVEASATVRVLEVTRRLPARDVPPTPAADDPDLAPNVLLQSDHPDVAALAASLRVAGAGAFVQSLVLRDWVATHLRFDAGLVVVPAGEAVRDRRGTCVAYAVLTAALARALGIPARVVLGYAYVDGVFAGHAWTEVRVGDEWFPIDGALYGDGSADAARIAIVRHGGELGIGSGTLELARLIGHLRIRIEAFTLDGRETRVAADARPWRVDGRRYTNPWLRLRLLRPRAYHYADLDAVYPDSTLLALEGPSGARVRLWNAAAGAAPLRPTRVLRALGYDAAPEARGEARCASGPKGRACVRRDGTTAWILEATPGDASRRLAAIADSLEIGAASAGD